MYTEQSQLSELMAEVKELSALVKQSLSQQALAQESRGGSIPLTRLLSMDDDISRRLAALDAKRKRKKR